nr:hypothetical protein [Tanacetum cinerariifolium]
LIIGSGIPRSDNGSQERHRVIDGINGIITFLEQLDQSLVGRIRVTDMMKLVIEIKCFGMSADEFDKETGLSNGMLPKQADLSCVHALNKPHLHEVHIVPKVVKLLAISSPPASPLSPWSSPPSQIPFPPLPPILSPPSPVLSPAPPPSPILSLGYRAAMIRLRDEAASTSSPPLQLPSARESSSAAAARPAGGFRVDYDFVATVDREIMRDPERKVSYGITDSWDEIVETLQGATVSTDTELGGYVREFETRVRQDTDEIYMRLDDEQTERQLLAGRLNMLFRDRRAHAYTCQLMETKARMSREAWVRATDASDLVHGEVIS